jgi:hypothetical protein
MTLVLIPQSDTKLQFTLSLSLSKQVGKLDFQLLSHAHPISMFGKPS